MPVTVYKSTDGSAPVLNGVAGSLVTVLDAILVNGYGAKAAAGWAKPYNGTNKAAYRAAAGAQHYLRVQDDAPNPTLAAGREARVKGYETMSAVDTGTNLFPTAAQLANGCFMRKSESADSTARPWICVADSKTFYLWAKTNDYGAGYAAMCFGEFYSLKSSADAYRSIIISRGIEQIAATPTTPAANESLCIFAALAAAVAGHYTPRDSSEMASAVNVGKHGNSAHSAAAMVGLYPYMTRVDGGLHLAPITIHEPMSALTQPRGRLRGLWHFLHPAGAAVADGDTFSGSGPLAGKTFLIIKPGADNQSIFVVETSDTWETN